MRRRSTAARHLRVENGRRSVVAGWNRSGGGRLVASRFRRRYWHPAVTVAGLDPLRVDDLRHTSAALAIEVGAHPRALMQRLGHSSITTTLDTYGSLMPGLDDQVAADVERDLGRRVEDVGGSSPESGGPAG